MKICGYCGKQFEEKQAYQKWCSSHCKALARQANINPNHLSREERHVTNTCKVCGKTWESTKSRALEHCSVACAHITLMRDNCICKLCGKEFRPKSTERITYCSRECSFKDRIVQAERREALTKLARALARMHDCPQCGKRISSLKKYCSDNCYKAAVKTEYDALHVSDRVYFNECKTCGKTFAAARPNAGYCSDAHRKRMENRKREIHERHTLRRNGKVDYSITLEKLVKRDKGVCHICGCKVNVKADINSGDYPSIDHVIPKSNGGPHQWWNVALAHRDCNSRKSASESFESLKGQLRWSF